VIGSRVLAALVALVALVALLAVTSPARADDVLTASAMADDPMASIFVGPSGQLWHADGQGAWVRDTQGGVAADVHGATLADVLVVVGRSAPPYRWDSASWQALRLGERGRTIAGTGPRAAVAVGGQIFVWTAPSWKRVGKVTGPVAALWAASDSKVFVAAGGKVWRLARGRFIEAGTADVLGFAGSAPHAITRDGQLYDGATRKTAPILLGGQPLVPLAIAVAPGGPPWVLGTVGQRPALARKKGSGWEAVPAPELVDGDPPIGFGVDAAGVAVVATRSGAIWLRATDGTWSAGRRDERPAPAHPGPGPARVP